MEIYKNDLPNIRSKEDIKKAISAYENAVLNNRKSENLGKAKPRALPLIEELAFGKNFTFKDENRPSSQEQNELKEKEAQEKRKQEKLEAQKIPSPKYKEFREEEYPQNYGEVLFALAQVLKKNGEPLDKIIEKYLTDYEKINEKYPALENE